MSINSQKNHMKTIQTLISQDLSYIFGPSENGLNGAKKQFHTISKVFLRALGKDLGFTEFKVISNVGGIAVSGEITLMGMWHGDNGLYFQIAQPLILFDGFMFRTIKDMKDFVGGKNQWLSCDIFQTGDYEALLHTLSELRDKSKCGVHYAA